MDANQHQLFAERVVRNQQRVFRYIVSLVPAPGWEHSIRALRGRIDELAIWNRALMEEELQRLVEAGRPGLLWGEGI